MDLITPATRQTVSEALRRHDLATLARYARFLDPVLASLGDSPQDQAPVRALLVARRAPAACQTIARSR